ncbi:hypothetical protein ACLOJK_014428 [Asimina triloba]
MGTNLISDDYDWINEVGGSDTEFRWSLDGFNDLPKAWQNVNVSGCIIWAVDLVDLTMEILSARISTFGWLDEWMSWSSDPRSGLLTLSKKLSRVEIDDGCKDVCGIEPTSSRKRARDDPLTGPKSKASREKLRREKLNDRQDQFMELGSVLDPGRPIKSDKALILSDAVRALVQLRNEAQQLKEANGKLQETIKDLKAEKNELRDEKIKLKADKERLEQQLKATTVPPPPPVGYMPHLAPLHAAAATAFAAQGQAAASNKTATFPAYPDSKSVNADTIIYVELAATYLVK